MDRGVKDTTEEIQFNLSSFLRHEATGIFQTIMYAKDAYKTIRTIATENIKNLFSFGITELYNEKFNAINVSFYGKVYN